MLLKKSGDTAMTRRIQISRRQQRTRGIKRRVIEAVQCAAASVLGKQDVGFVQRLTSDPKTMTRNFELRRHYNATLSRWTDFRNGVCPHTG